MDPQQSRCYATAQRELLELFREISSQGQVGPVELQTALLPFTAGDVRKDVLELIEELQRRHKSSVDEQEFIRVMWKKMYLSHFTLHAKCRPSSASSTRAATSSSSSSSSAARHNSAQSSSAESASTAADEINIPLAHVIVSIKRRSQLRQFADYYSSRGISGANHLTAEVSVTGGGSSGASESSSRGSPPRAQLSPQHHLHRRRVCFDRGVPIPVTTLRAHTSPSYRVLACVFNPSARAIATLNMFPRPVRVSQVVNCSRLFCLLFAKDAGNYVIGSAHFAQQVHCKYVASVCAKRASDDVLEKPPSSNAQAVAASPPLPLPLPLSVRDGMLVLTKLDDLGLRNVVTAASSEGSFVASTERKVHHWTVQVSSAVVSGDVQPSDSHANSSSNNNSSSSEDLSSDCHLEPSPVGISLDDEGDCFGVLGAKKLLARTKNIADVSFVKQLVAGQHFVLALTATADLLAWGDSTIGGHELAPSRTPWFRTDKVVRIACGRHHVLAATSSGLAYSWGSNLFGQLGHGGKSSSTDAPVVEPIAIRIPHSRSLQRAAVTTTSTSTNTSAGASSAPDSNRAVLDVACGDDHSIVLLASGRIYAFGSNWQGQLGLDPGYSADGCVFEPTGVVLNDDSSPPVENVASSSQTSALASPPTNTRVYLISAIGTTSAAVTTRGDVFQWGLCIPSGPESVCGLVSRWQPQLVHVGESESESDEPKQRGAPRLLWHSIAIANGLVVLTRHTEPLLA